MKPKRYWKDGRIVSEQNGTIPSAGQQYDPVTHSIKQYPETWLDPRFRAYVSQWLDVLAYGYHHNRAVRLEWEERERRKKT